MCWSGLAPVPDASPYLPSPTNWAALAGYALKGHKCVSCEAGEYCSKCNPDDLKVVGCVGC